MQVFSSLDGGIDGNWEYSFYQGFKIKNVSWDLGGEYICLGEFQTPSSLSGGVISYNKISRNHSFVIDVKGCLFHLFKVASNCNSRKLDSRNRAYTRGQQSNRRIRSQLDV